MSTAMACPICDSLSYRVFEKHDYWIRECVNCHHRFCEIEPSANHVASVYNDDYFFGGAAGYSDYLSEANLLIEHGERYSKIIRRFTEPGKMLDVGAAAGFIMKGFQNQGWSGIGIEPNSSMAHYAQTELGLDVRLGTLEDYATDERYDLVTMIQVVAHYYHVRRAFQAAAALTKSGSYLLIETWNKDSCAARALGENWHEYSPPSVLQWFSPDTLKLLVESYGFTQVDHGIPSKWLRGAHAKSLIRFKSKRSRLEREVSYIMNFVPDGLSLPYPSRDLFWALFSKNF